MTKNVKDDGFALTEKPEIVAALGYFGVVGTPQTLAMIVSMNLWHNGLSTDQRDLPHLKALCGVPASLREADK